MGQIEVRLLSGFEVRIDDLPVGLQPASERLVAFVALNPRGVHRDFAALQLWADVEEARASANLRSALWRLRKHADGLVEATKTCLRLGAGVWLDVRDGLDEAVGAGRSALAPTPFSSVCANLLPDWYDEWLEVDRERLRQHQLGLLESRARDALDRGDTTDAIQSGLTAVSIDPLRESSHRVVIEAHLVEGNAAEARREFERYRVAVEGQLGLSPSAQMVALVGVP